MNAREFNLQQLARGLPLRRTNQALQLLRLSGRYLVAETRAFLAVTRVYSPSLKYSPLLELFPATGF